MREGWRAAPRARPSQALCSLPPLSHTPTLPPAQDGTLLLTTTARDPSWGPVSASDWRFFNPTVPAKLAQLGEEGYEVVVLR